MTTIATKNNIKVEFNGSKTYFVSNEFECVKYFDTERKAINYMNKIA